MRSLSSQIKTAGFIILGALTLFCAFLYLDFNNQIQLARAADQARDQQDVAGKLAVTAKQIQIDVVQVQQFLTDISATRGQNGLDDGPGEAAKNAADFHIQVDKAKAYASQLHLDNVTQALNAVDSKFPGYYATGQDMANAYVSGGTEAGNAFMPQFDEASAGEYESVDRVLKIVDSEFARISTVTNEATKASVKNGQSSQTVTLLIGLLITGLVGGALWLVLRSAVQPLTDFTQALSRISAGAHDTQVMHTAKRNEIGEVARAMDGFRLAQIDAKAADIRNEAGRLERRARREGLEKAIISFKSHVDQALEALHLSTNGMQDVSTTLEDISIQTAKQSQNASSATLEATDNVQIVAAAAEELAASIADISEKITMSQVVVQDTSKASAESEANIDRLAKASERIGDVVNLIQNIASQTNLLALNATIEAARAGDAGKGFAVVATEVKALADQTSRATQEIAKQVSDIQTETREAVDSIKTIAGRMDEVQQYTLAISAAVEQQTRATQDIAANVSKAADCTTNAQQSVQIMASSVERTKRSAEQVSQSTAELLEEKDNLSSTIESFLQAVAV